MWKQVEYIDGVTPRWKRRASRWWRRYSQATQKYVGALGVSATHLDWTMVPYVRKSFYKHFKDGMNWVERSPWEESAGFEPADYSIDSELYTQYKGAYQYAMCMTERETKQAAEGLFHNLNTLQSRSGNQLPFTSINFGTCTLPEGRMVIKALLEVSIDGLGQLHKTSVFPCSIFQCKKGVNREPGDPNYDLFQLALKSTSLRLYPNYVNCDVTMQKNWVAYDREEKRKVIEALSDEDYAKLIERLEENPKLKNTLMLDVVFDGRSKRLSVRQEEIPIELMSTMGRHYCPCKTP